MKEYLVSFECCFEIKTHLNYCERHITTNFKPTRKGIVEFEKANAKQHAPYAPICLGNTCDYIKVLSWCELEEEE